MISAKEHIAEYLDDREDWEIAWERCGRKPAYRVPGFVPELIGTPAWMAPQSCSYPEVDCESSELGIYE